MAGEDGRAITPAVGLDHAIHKHLALAIEVGVRLIEQPQARGRKQQHRQRGALALAGRQHPHRQRLVALEADAAQGGRGRDAGSHALERGAETQVLERREVGLEPELVAQQRDAAWRRLQRLPGFAAPQHAAGARGEQSRQNADQGGLAGAVAAFDRERRATVEAEVQRPEDRLVLAREAQAAHLDQGRQVVVVWGRHRCGWSGRMLTHPIDFVRFSGRRSRRRGERRDVQHRRVAAHVKLRGDRGTVLHDAWSSPSRPCRPDPGRAGRRGVRR